MPSLLIKNGTVIAGDPVAVGARSAVAVGELLEVFVKEQRGERGRGDGEDEHRRYQDRGEVGEPAAHAFSSYRRRSESCQQLL